MPGYVARAQGVRREAESEGREANVQAETTSEPEVAFRNRRPAIATGKSATEHSVQHS